MAAKRSPRSGPAKRSAGGSPKECHPGEGRKQARLVAPRIRILIIPDPSEARPMDAWWQCEIPYPFVPRAVLDAAQSVRGSLPNRYCDPKVAADLFEEVIDEFLLCDDLGLNVLAVEHHAGINSLLGANPLLVGILARQTRQVRILSLGTLISLREDP